MCGGVAESSAFEDAGFGDFVAGGPPLLPALGDELISRREESLDDGADASADGAWGGVEEVGDLRGGEVVAVDGGDEGAVVWEEVLGAEDEEVGEVPGNSPSEVGGCLDIETGLISGILMVLMEHKAPLCASLNLFDTDLCLLFRKPFSHIFYIRRASLQGFCLV